MAWRQIPDPRGASTIFRSGSVLCIVAMAVQTEKQGDGPHCEINAARTLLAENPRDISAGSALR